MSDTLGTALASTLRELRRARGLSGGALAELSGVSRGMISRIENGEAQPTASLLGRLAAALGITLSELIARAERGDRRLVRAREQPVWTDPGTGYRRRAVSPASGGPIELVEVELPPGARVGFPARAYALTHHQIWVLEGTLAFREGGVEHVLERGDCLHLGPPEPCEFHNPTGADCRYLVVVSRRGT
ncbi:XRE family transcriptional regulator [Nocardiopsis dassonvillei]|jgi:transcriptional regulator with XRE-family HTH domain|uniref:helix-turn-helix domain-containing protein n=1 Tax=Nocardiopsis dassonvillei TaxID=2014 RepID=UPI00102AC33F|nr:XRE family transcriptional regulator [Nocardiopsis dassonvillei]MCP3012386.1 XRE family transcriptional regulator [Nocardiopsis dassonvillei]